MKKITKDLGVAGACRLPGWGPRDSPHQWLRNSQDIARNRQQWRTCCHPLTTNNLSFPTGTFYFYVSVLLNRLPYIMLRIIIFCLSHGWMAVVHRYNS